MTIGTRFEQVGLMVFNVKMPSELMGLPLHPLTVHLPVVLVPLLVLLALGYVLIPPLRRHLGWAVFVLTIAAPLSVYAARVTGERLAADLGGMTPEVSDHAGHSEVLIWLLIALAPITWLFGALERGRRAARKRAEAHPSPPPAAEGEESAPTKPLPSDDDPASKGRRIVMTVLGLVMIGLVLVSAVYLFRAGDSGARMVWENVLG